MPGYVAHTLDTPRGPVATRLSLPDGARAGAVLVGGIGGGFDTPARDLYPRLADDLLAAGHAALRVRFRHATVLGEAVADVRAGVAALAARGVDRVVLVGHSFGGAVVVQAAAAEPAAVGVVTLATQSAGTGAVTGLTVPLLLLHGTADPVLPPAASRSVASRAGGDVALELLDGVGHDLLEARDAVHATVRDWVLARLGAGTDAR